MAQWVLGSSSMCSVGGLLLPLPLPPSPPPAHALFLSLSLSPSLSQINKICLKINKYNTTKPNCYYNYNAPCKSTWQSKYNTFRDPGWLSQLSVKLYESVGLCAQHGAWTHNPKIKSHVLYWLSQLGAPLLIHFFFNREGDSQWEREHRGSGRGRSRLIAKEPDMGLDP